MNDVRILLLAGLSSIHTIRWANVLANRGFDVHVVSQQAAIDKLDAKVTIYKLPDLGSLGYFLMVPFLRRLIKRLRPDVINAHYASGYGTAARFAGAPFLLSIWGSDVYKFPYRSKIHHALIRSNIMAATTVASTSLAMARQIREIAPFVDQIVLTPFGVDTNKFFPMSETKSIETNRLVIGTVKGLDYVYGVDILIKAFANVKNLRPATPMVLKIVGEGPAEERLRNLVEQKGIKDITVFEGRVKHNDVPVHLREFDIYVALSRSESFGVAILEASACGIPVLVSDVGGLPEVVCPSLTGYIVPSENVDVATCYLLKLVDDSNLRKQMGNMGIQFVEKNYSWHACVENFIEVLMRHKETTKKQ